MNIQAYRLVCIVALLSVLAACQKDITITETADTRPHLLQSNNIAVNNVIKGFYSAVPANYNQTTTKYPLLIFLHGGGQTGNGNSDLPSVLNEGVPKLLYNKTFPASFTVNGKVFSFIVLAPQFTQYPSNYEVETFINYGINHYRVDPTRVYLAGLSMGGSITADVGADYTKYLAAIVAMSGVSDTHDTSITGKLKNITAAKLPVWVFQNENDQVANPTQAKNYISLLNGLNPVIAPRFTLFPPMGPNNHDAWTRATDPNYRENEVNIYEWMLRYTR